jgi:hypothetical protein
MLLASFSKEITDFCRDKEHVCGAGCGEIFATHTFHQLHGSQMTPGKQSGNRIVSVEENKLGNVAIKPPCGVSITAISTLEYLRIQRSFRLPCKPFPPGILSFDSPKKPALESFA